MNVLTIILAGFVATTMMTLFSYLVSWIRSSLFKEPELLNMLISRTGKIPVSVSRHHFLGWLIHYLIGWLFVICFDLVWRYTALEASIVTGAVLGLFAGFIGVAGWKTMFYFNPNEPRIEFANFYLQLVIAHVIFGVGAGWIYQYW